MSLNGLNELEQSVIEKAAERYNAGEGGAAMRGFIAGAEWALRNARPLNPRDSTPEAPASGREPPGGGSQ